MRISSTEVRAIIEPAGLRHTRTVGLPLTTTERCSRSRMCSPSADIWRETSGRSERTRRRAEGGWRRQPDGDWHDHGEEDDGLDGPGRQPVRDDAEDDGSNGPRPRKAAHGKDDGRLHEHVLGDAERPPANKRPRCLRHTGAAENFTDWLKGLEAKTVEIVAKGETDGAALAAALEVSEDSANYILGRLAAAGGITLTAKAYSRGRL